MSDTTRYINCGNTSGTEDGLLPSTGYTTLLAGLTAEATTIASGDTFTFECLTENSVVDTGRVPSFSSWTITGNLYIKAYTGHEAVCSGLDTSLYSMSNALEAIVVDNDNITIDGIQIYCSSTSVCINVNGSTNCILKNCYFHSLAGSAVAVYGTSDVCSIDKCIAYSVTQDGSSEGFYTLGASSTTTVTNCIVYNYNDGIELDGGAITVSDSVVFNNGDDFDGVTSITTCASDDGDGTDPISPLNGVWTDEYTDPVNGDFTQKVSGNIYLAGVYTLGTSTTTVTYTLTYDSNTADSGTVPTDATDYASGDSATILGNIGTLVKADYSFGGWNTSSDGSGTTYAETDTFTISANTTLYAQWDLVLVTYTVTYDGNSNDGGTVPVDGSSPYDSGSSVTILGNTGSLTLTGYIFVAWNTASDGTGTNRESADTFTISADTTLYALWKTEAELIAAYLTPTTVGGRRPRARYLGV